MNDKLFSDSTLLPPGEIITNVNPFKRALMYILAGLALNMITLNFAKLNYILPFAGLLLMLMGFRRLRCGNAWFHTCFILTAVRLAYHSAVLVLNTTIFNHTMLQEPLFALCNHITALLFLLLLFCLGKGIASMQKKCMLPVGAGGTVALMAWYVILYVLALSPFNGTVAAIIMLVAFIFIIISLYDLSKELDEAGYTLTPPLVKISDWLLCAIICVAVTAGGLCGYLFGSEYKMQWQPREPLPQFGQVKSQLAFLGFPEEILNDLTEADLLDCSNALAVKVESQLHPANKGRAVTETTADSSGRKIISHYTVYDQKELCITSVAVKLPGETETWKIFHHFSWQTSPSFYGTECIRIIPAHSFNASLGWMNAGGISGQILYSDNNTTYSAPYEYLGEYTHTSKDIIFGESTSRDIYATFSFPRSGTNHRGYVCYTTREAQQGWILSSWINYTHQTRLLQYPNQTAMENTLKGIPEKSDSFISVQDAIQFFPDK